MGQTIFVPRESDKAEPRVAASPETVKRYVGLGFDVVVEAGAGSASRIIDDEFAQAGAKIGKAADAGKADIVLGDRFGTSCDPELTVAAESALRARGYRVLRNKPYAGGFITEHYGHPASHVHALQIEINRAVYMNETTFHKSPRFAQLAEDLTAMAQALADCAGGLACWRAAAE